MSLFRWLFLPGAVLLGVSACGEPVGPVSSTAAEPLRIAAASDLQTTLPEVVARFGQDHPGQVDLVFGSSGDLARQIGQGAPYALFLSADHSFVANLADEKVIDPRSVRPYAVGSLALAVPEDSTVEINRPEDLLSPSVRRIALANPDLAPYGRAARETLQQAGLWEQLEPKLVLAPSVRQALQFVQSGNVDAAFIGRALTDAPGVALAAYQPEGYSPIVQWLGVTPTAPRAAEAALFVDLLLSDQGQEILSRHGFRPPPSR